MRSSQFEKRRSGIPSVGDLPWGSHFCQFFETKKDLLDLLVPYFRAGLENNEVCYWMTGGPLSVADATRAMAEAVPNLAEYVEKGQLEISPAGGDGARRRDTDRAIVTRLDDAVARGFDGLRLACPAVPARKGGPAFACPGLESTVNLNVIAAYLYPRERFDAVGLMEVVKAHRFALVRSGERFELLESSEALSFKEALRRSEEKLHSLFSNMSEGFAYHRILLDARGQPCDYVFLEINEAFARLTGLEAEKIVGRRATEALPGIETDPAGWIRRYGDVALTGKPAQFESYSSALDRWYSVSAFSPHRGFFAVTFSDITERKRAEEKIVHQASVLGAINRIFREGIDCSSDEELGKVCLAVAEDVTGSKLGVIDEVKSPDRLLRIAMSDPGRNLCRMADRVNHGDTPPADLAVRGFHRRVLKEGRGFFSNDLASNPDRAGTPPGHPEITTFLCVPLSQHGEVVGIMAVANREGGYRSEDLSALQAVADTFLQMLLWRRAETERRAVEERLGVTLRSIGDAVLSTDARGRVTFLNRVAMELTGINEMDALGRPAAEVFRIINESTRHPGEDIVSRVLRERRTVALANHTSLVARDGREIPIEDSAAPIFADDGEVAGVVLVFHDVTAKRKSQLALRQAHEELEGRVQTRTKELADAYSELEARARQLRALAGELTLVEQRERRRIAQLLHDNLQQLLVGAKLRVSTVERLADSTALDALAEINILLDEAIQSSRTLTAEISPPILYERGLVPALRWLVGWVAQKHDLTVELRAQDIPVHLPEDVSVLLFESVREILFNVVKHAGVSEARVEVGKSDGVLRITIDDEGRGFDPDPSRRSRSAGGGYGLFSIRERLGLLGGVLAIDSTPGSGSRVILSVPMTGHPGPARRSENVPAVTEPVSSPRVGGRIRVLVIDDHPVMRDGLARLLAPEADIEVIGEASDGRTAIDLAGKLRPDVVLMDVNMAGMSGVVATRLIRKQLPHVKVIGLSMLDEPETVNAMIAAGACAYVTKSGPTEDIVRAVRESARGVQ